MLLVRQRILELLPEERVAPLQNNVVLEQESQVWIKEVGLNVAQKDKDELLGSVVDSLEQS